MQTDGAPDIIPMERRYLEKALDIYRWYVRNSTATFQIADPDLSQMEGLLFFDSPRYRSFAVLDGGACIGYGIVTRYKTREAFDNTAEITVYLDHEATGRGIGRAVVARLEEFARERGMHALVALISGENAASCALFERAGYEKCAHYREVGFKFDRWLDLVCYEKIL